MTKNNLAHVLLAVDALNFDAGDWKPESIERHLREQIELARKHLQSIVDNEEAAGMVVVAADRIADLEDKITRLKQFAAESGVAYRDDDSNLITEGFRSLPDALQAAINALEEKIDLDRGQQ
ncbi:hypothetical protein SAMN03080615_01621 [Amphritea atlantica]|uniref:Uncharacterized protein n=1 Tax=Amphritea atlantica TaxID=355243 RepID=A0A1H9GDF7_9GAMM|nr:hypothetical protein [Amphritea atlantica]SEQ48152.1 hypothetical protein SAMN03080615_01621 [Amphritea atlantica]